VLQLDVSFIIFRFFAGGFSIHALPLVHIIFLVQQAEGAHLIIQYNPVPFLQGQLFKCLPAPGGTGLGQCGSSANQHFLGTFRESCLTPATATFASVLFLPPSACSFLTSEAALAVTSLAVSAAKTVRESFYFCSTNSSKAMVPKKEEEMIDVRAVKRRRGRPRKAPGTEPPDPRKGSVLDPSKGVYVDPVGRVAILEVEGPGPPVGVSERKLSPDRGGEKT
jgi:hypothetical protein